MKRTKSKRDIVWLLLGTALALSPLYLLVRGRQQASSRVMGYSGTELALSPDGVYLASSEHPEPSVTASPFSNRDLVVRRVEDGQEIVRMPLSNDTGKRLMWSSDQTLIAATGSDVNIWGWTGTAQLGKQTWSRSNQNGNQTFSRDIKELKQIGSFSTGSFGENSQLELDSDVFVQRDSDGRFEARQISIPRSIPLAPGVGRQDLFSRSDWDCVFAVQPVPVASAPALPASAMPPSAPTTPVRVLVVQKEPTPTPTPSPSPSPTPAPTPLTQQQKAFLEKEKIENAQIEKLVESVLGVDGTPPPPISAEREHEIEVEVKQRNAALSEEKNRLFPPPPTPVPPPPTYYWASVELWDLVAGKPLWKRRIKTNIQVPHPLWSPDGQHLALLGVPVVATDARQNNQQNAIALLDPATGCEKHLVKMDGYISSFDYDKIRFFPVNSGFELFVPLNSNHWDFYDVRTGQILTQWKIDRKRAKNLSPYHWSANHNGSRWVFLLYGDRGTHWISFSKAEMQARFGS